jgi:hypothetical protein
LNVFSGDPEKITTIIGPLTKISFLVIAGGTGERDQQEDSEEEAQASGIHKPW